MDWDNAFLLFPAPLQTELEWEDFSGPEAEPLLPSPQTETQERPHPPSRRKEGANISAKWHLASCN